MHTRRRRDQLRLGDVGGVTGNSRTPNLATTATLRKRALKKSARSEAGSWATSGKGMAGKTESRKFDFL